MNQYDVGVITDGVLGCNLAYNLSANGYSAVLYHAGLENMTREEISRHVSGVQEMGILASTSVEMTVNLLKTPRLLLVVSSDGLFTEEILKELYDFTGARDIIIDTCDANYKITAKRCRVFEQKKVEYMGVGFSGGEAGALNGASVMAGGSLDAYNAVYEILSGISSKYDGYPCCAYMGPEGAGQYVKMIHNGIEYGILHLLSEAVAVLTKAAGCDQTELSEIIGEWASGDNESYLIQALYEVLKKKDAETGQFLSEIASDRVGYSKSVVWLCGSANELSVPVPSIYAALNLRFLSSMKQERTALFDMTGGLETAIHIVNDERKAFISDIKNALYLSSVCVFTQAFALLRKASELYLWETDPLDAAITFQGNSFIRSRLLVRVIDAFRNYSGIRSLLDDTYFAGTVKLYASSLRRTLQVAVAAGVPTPVLSASLSYLDTYASPELGTGVVELLRDYIQATGFEKKDEASSRFYADWKNIRDEIICEEKKPSY